MRFGDPVYFNLLWILPALTIFFFWARKKKQKMMERFCESPLIAKLSSPHLLRKQRNKTLLMILGFGFLILALTQPRWGFEWEDLRQEGVDIIIAVDVSNSMLAEDIKPNRLERAKRKIADLLNMLDGDRIGLVAFAGTSYLQCPLTLDYAAAEIFLDAIDTDLIPIQGTAIGGAIRTAIKAFSQMEKKSKALILITDGEDHEGKALQAAREAKGQGIKIFTIGIGQKIGAPMPSRKPGGGFKKDKSGEVVVSRLNETVLQKISLATGGSYVRSVTGDMDLNKIYREDIKERIEKKELKTTRRKLWQAQFQWLIFAALACFTLERAIREKQDNRSRFLFK